MKYPLTLTFLITFALLACGSSTPKKAPSADSTLIAKNDTIPANVIDTSKTIVVDDYPVTYEMFLYNKIPNSRHSTKVGDLEASDKAWLSNDSLKQTIVVELYTDGFRNIIFHFLNNDVLDQLIDRMEMHVHGELAPLEQKKNAFPKFIAQSNKIQSRYFTSNKGFKLGDSKQKALGIYGAPYIETIDKDLEILEWHYAGDQMNNVEDELKYRPRAKNNYGHQVKMFFRNDKLIAMILHNEIP